jgi:hypothetical protein
MYKMSQSDYIKFKKTGVKLREQTKHDAVYSSTDYTSFVNYSLEKLHSNDKPTYNQLTPSGKKTIFDMELNVSTPPCPDFKVCHGTDTRPNRVTLAAYQSTCFPVMKAPGRTVPRYIKKPLSNAHKYKMNCKCKNVSCVCTAHCESDC